VSPLKSSSGHRLEPGGGCCVSTDDLQDIAALKTVFDGAVASQFVGLAGGGSAPEWTTPKSSRPILLALAVARCSVALFCQTKDQKPTQSGARHQRAFVAPAFRGLARRVAGR